MTMIKIPFLNITMDTMYTNHVIMRFNECFRLEVMFVGFLGNQQLCMLNSMITLALSNSLNHDNCMGESNAILGIYARNTHLE